MQLSALQSTSARVVTMQQPSFVKWLVIDIETGDPSPENIEAAIAAWKPPSNIKDPEKIEARRAEARAKIKDKGALLDTAPILCAAMKSDSGSVIFGGMGDFGPLEIHGWAVVNLDSERSMLESMTAYLDAFVGLETVISGFNVQAFDLPKLRSAYVRNRLPLPQCLRVTDQMQPMFDVMRRFRFFSAEHYDSLFVSLDTVALSFGIPKPKSVVSGADVPRMHKEGKCGEIMTYCAIDVEVTAQIYQAMTL